KSEGEMVEAMPIPGKLMPVQKHHEVGQDWIAINTARADLAHEMHAHRVAAERKKRAVTERENAAIAPDEIDRKSEQCIAQELARQSHDISRYVKRCPFGNGEIKHGKNDADCRKPDEQERRPAMAEQETSAHDSTALPFSAKSPRGRR